MMSISDRAKFRLGARIAILSSAALFSASFASVASARDAASAFSEGVKAAERGDAAAACRLFEESHRLEASDGALLNVGGCREARGDLVGAYNAFAEVAVNAERANRKDRVAVATEGMKGLEPKVARVALSKTPAGRGRLSLDQASSPLLLDRALAVSPGTHQVQWTPESGPAVTQTFSAVVGSVVTVSLDAPASAPAPTPIARSDRDGSGTSGSGSDDAKGSSTKTLGFVLGGVGVVALGACAVTGVMAFGKKSDADAAQQRFDRASFEDANDQGKSLAVVSTIAGAAGALAVAGGVYLIVASSKSSNRDRTELRVSPLLGATQGAALTGAF